MESEQLELDLFTDEEYIDAAIGSLLGGDLLDLIDREIESWEGEKDERIDTRNN